LECFLCSFVWSFLEITSWIPILILILVLILILHSFLNGREVGQASLVSNSVWVCVAS